MPDVVISYLNNLSDAEANGSEADLNFRIGEEQKDVTDMEPEDRDDDYRDYASAVARKFITVQDHDDVYDPVMESGLEESNVNEEVSVPAENVERQDIQGVTSEEETTEEVAYVPRREGLRPSRAAPGTYTRREYGLHMTARQAIDKLGNAARKSVVKEIQQLLDRRSWHGVRMSNIPKEERKRIIPCKLFVKEKYSASGDFEKVKSRLVAGGHRQDARLYKDKTCSPTVATPSVFMLATIAQAESRAIATVDIPGAYLNAQMPGNVRVRMRLDASISNVVIQLDPSYAQFVCDDGSIIVELDKALYGLKESALLWYELLCERLRSIGFKQNRYDRCVFNRYEKDGTQCSLCVHVDDFMITAKDEDHLEHVLNDMTNSFGDITVTRGRKHNYLGMVFNFEQQDSLEISMLSAVEELLNSCDVGSGIASSPATVNLFRIDASSNLLSTGDKEFFHSVVASLLYLSKRVRPDLLLAISFLTTRVQNPTQQDLCKLMRVLKYLNATKDLVLHLRGDDFLCICAYIDASFAVHDDYKSHSGVFVSIGMGPIFVKSSKQRLNSKSSTEAEMIAVSDGLNHVLWIRNYLCDQGYKLPAAKIFQDNMSAIALFKTGKSASSMRTRHIAIRFYFVKDRMDSGEVEVTFKGTDDMIADILTKPLQGTKFKELRARLMGYTK